MTGPWQNSLQEALKKHQQGRLLEAELAYQALLQQWPGCADAWHLLGHLLTVSDDRFEDGMEAIERAISLCPEKAVYHFNKGTILLKSDRPEAALPALLEVVRLQPGILPGYLNLAATYRSLGDDQQAIICLQEALKKHPDEIDLRRNLATLLAQQGRFSEAIEHFRSLVRAVPDDAQGHLQLAHALKAVASLAEAEKHLRRALALAPGLAEARHALANIVRHQPGDEDIVNIEQQLQRCDIDIAARERLNFALGKAYDDVADYARAHVCFSLANHLQRQQRGVSTTVADFGVLQRAFAKPLPALPQEEETKQPRFVFIVGMPRSGSSLLEQILASHSDVYGAGETAFLQTSVEEIMHLSGLEAGATFFDRPELITSLSAASMTAIRQCYREHMQRQAARHQGGGKAVMSDKMPHNFRLLGLIAPLFPDAVILHTRRHPLDVCLSCFQQRFVGDHAYSQDLLDLGHYYLAYERLMTFWQQQFPERIHGFDYQALVDDPEGQIRRLLTLCRLPWDDRCLDFHRSERAVATASDAQVREPIYQRSIARWRHYETALQPLRTLFEEHGILIPE